MEDMARFLEICSYAAQQARNDPVFQRAAQDCSVVVQQVAKSSLAQGLQHDVFASVKRAARPPMMQDAPCEFSRVAEHVAQMPQWCRTWWKIYQQLQKDREAPSGVAGRGKYFVRANGHDVKMPALASSDEASYDVFSTEDVTIEPGASADINLGFTLVPAQGSMPVHYPQVFARSGSQAKKGIFVHPNILDDISHGDLHVKLLNLGTSSMHIRTDERIAEIVFQLYKPTVSFELMEK